MISATSSSASVVMIYGKGANPHAVEKPTRHRGGRAAPCLGTIGNHRVVAMIRDAALGRQVHTYAQVSTPDRRQALYLSWVIVSLG